MKRYSLTMLSGILGVAMLAAQASGRTTVTVEHGRMVVTVNVAFQGASADTVDRWAISPKIWHECIYCQKFDACDEIAMLMNLTEPAPQFVPPVPNLPLLRRMRFAAMAYR